ncbi:hypothetical protein MKZ38_010499 [Zalerion maritima]|uniref:PD-(D/E)XK nuclease-like domain-containing protein n=1 Tax=Zalerion maritima TaxID=339359 RepID=A0AAD5WMU7_9PEZI|nr:hypothetical protein MKZ38_010499 [Zalerion maritima]
MYSTSKAIHSWLARIEPSSDICNHYQRKRKRDDDDNAQPQTDKPHQPPRRTKTKKSPGICSRSKRRRNPLRRGRRHYPSPSPSGSHPEANTNMQDAAVTNHGSLQHDGEHYVEPTQDNDRTPKAVPPQRLGASLDSHSNTSLQIVTPTKGGKKRPPPPQAAESISDPGFDFIPNQHQQEPRHSSWASSSKSSSSHPGSSASSIKRRRTAPAIVRAIPGVPEPTHFGQRTNAPALDNLAQVLQRTGVYNRFVWPDMQPAAKELAATDSRFQFLTEDIWYYSSSSEAAAPQSALGPCPSLIDIANILDNALKAEGRGDCEAEWNTMVHSPLLRLALSQHIADGSLYVSNCTSATIMRDYNPTGDKGITRKVDFGITVEVAKSDPRVTALATSINESINATSHPAYTHTPIAVPVETKVGSVDEAEAITQLGLWLSAHVAKLESLVRRRFDDAAINAGNSTAENILAKQRSDTAWNAAVNELQFLPAVMILQHDWYFVAITFGPCHDWIQLADGQKRRKVRVWRKIKLGTTENPEGICQIIHGLRKVAWWSMNSYWPWFTGWILDKEN